MKQALATAQAPAAIGPYSQGIAAGQTVYVSGQLPIDPATGAIPEGIAAPVSYTHLTLPTKRIVWISVGAVSLTKKQKKKKKKNTIHRDIDV